MQLRSQAEFEALHGCKAPAGKRYFQHTRLGDIIGAYPFRSGLADGQLAAERKCREAFLDFLLGVLVRAPSLALFACWRVLPCPVCWVLDSSLPVRVLQCATAYSSSFCPFSPDAGFCTYWRRSPPVQGILCSEEAGVAWMRTSLGPEALPTLAEYCLVPYARCTV